MLGELVQTTAGKWITHPPTRCPNGHQLGPGRCSSVTKPASGMAAGTPPGPAEHATNRVRAAAQHALHDTRRACKCADLQRRVVERCSRRHSRAVILLGGGLGGGPGFFRGKSYVPMTDAD